MVGALFLFVFAVHASANKYPHQSNNDRRHHIPICRLGARRIVDLAPEYDRTNDDPRYREHRIQITDRRRHHQHA